MGELVGEGEGEVEEVVEDVEEVRRRKGMDGRR